MSSVHDARTLHNWRDYIDIENKCNVLKSKRDLHEKRQLNLTKKIEKFSVMHATSHRRALQAMERRNREVNERNMKFVESATDDASIIDHYVNDISTDRILRDARNAYAGHLRVALPAFLQSKELIEKLRKEVMVKRDEAEQRKTDEINKGVEAQVHLLKSCSSSRSSSSSSRSSSGAGTSLSASTLNSSTSTIARAIIPGKSPRSGTSTAPAAAARTSTWNRPHNASDTSSGNDTNLFVYSDTSQSQSRSSGSGSSTNDATPPSHMKSQNVSNSEAQNSRSQTSTVSVPSLWVEATEGGRTRDSTGTRESMLSIDTGISEQAAAVSTPRSDEGGAGAVTSTDEAAAAAAAATPFRSGTNASNQANDATFQSSMYFSASSPVTNFIFASRNSPASAQKQAEALSFPSSPGDRRMQNVSQANDLGANIAQADDADSTRVQNNSTSVDMPNTSASYSSYRANQSISAINMTTTVANITQKFIDGDLTNLLDDDEIEDDEEIAQAPAIVDLEMTMK